MTKESCTQENKPIPMEYIKENLTICPESPSGLRWITQRGSNKPGAAGGPNVKGRYVVTLGGSLYLAHRIVYALHIGEDPGEAHVDHWDGDPLNNRPNNLRKATQSQNSMNRGLRSDNTSGVPGVYWHKKSGGWQARIKKDGRVVSKCFKVLEDAAAWVTAKRLELFGEFAPENRQGFIEVAREPVPEVACEPLQLALFG